MMVITVLPPLGESLWTFVIYESINILPFLNSIIIMFIIKATEGTIINHDHNR